MLTISVPENFEAERINQIYSFDLEEFIADMKYDYEDAYTENNQYFTADNAEAYILSGITVCEKEFHALLQGEALANPYEYAWEVKK